jgi:hypothetical protein
MSETARCLTPEDSASRAATPDRELSNRHPGPTVRNQDVDPLAIFLLSGSHRLSIQERKSMSQTEFAPKLKSSRLMSAGWLVLLVLSGGGCDATAPLDEAQDDVTESAELARPSFLQVSTSPQSADRTQYFGHACGVASDGTVSCWGNYYLGNGTTEKSVFPLRVAGLSDVVAVSAGMTHTCALTRTGGVSCWGSASAGIIPQGTGGIYDGPESVLKVSVGIGVGDGTTATRPLPVNIISSGVKAIATGAEHSCALLLNGKVKCWGQNVAGQLGDGTKRKRLSPVEATFVSGGALQLAAGGDSTCAVVSNGNRVTCWGSVTRDSAKFVRNYNFTSPVKTLTVGDTSACVISMNGKVSCWGDMFDMPWNQAELIPETDPVWETQSATTPYEVVGLPTGLEFISAGGRGAYGSTTCAAKADGDLYCWGDNWGQPIVGTVYPPTTPQTEDFSTWRQSIHRYQASNAQGISSLSNAGGRFCVTTGAGGARCWGFGRTGALGDGTFDVYANEPRDVRWRGGAPVLENVIAFFPGFNRSGPCAIAAASPSAQSGSVYCWGGQEGPVQNTTLAAAFQGIGTDIKAINNTCALSASGRVTCWVQAGSQYIDPLSSQLTRIDLGITGAVALTAEGFVLTSSGGVKQIAFAEPPAGPFSLVDVPGLASGIKFVTGSYALTTAGGVKAWSFYETTPAQDIPGLTSGVQKLVPPYVVMNNGTVKRFSQGAGGFRVSSVSLFGTSPKELVATEHQACAIRPNGSVRCAVRFNDTVWYETPNQQAVFDVPGVVAASSSLSLWSKSGWYGGGCVIISGGEVACWTYGDPQSTDIIIDPNNPPPPKHQVVVNPSVVIGGLVGAAQLYARDRGLCAVMESGRVRCQGSNADGQLGNGTFIDSVTPVLVRRRN